MIMISVQLISESATEYRFKIVPLANIVFTTPTTSLQHFSLESFEESVNINYDYNGSFVRFDEFNHTVAVYHYKALESNLEKLQQH